MFKKRFKEISLHASDERNIDRYPIEIPLNTFIVNCIEVLTKKKIHRVQRGTHDKIHFTFSFIHIVYEKQKF